MKISTFLLLFIFCCLANFTTSAQDTDNSTIRKIGSFDKVSLSGPFEIYLKKGDKSAVDIETEHIDPNDIITEIRNNTLHVELKDRKLKYKDLDDKSVIHITYTSLKKIDWNGAGKIKTESVLEADKFELNISGAGNVNMDLDVHTLNVEMSGAGNLEMKGNADSQTVMLSGAGNYNGFELKSEKANVHMSGVGNIRVYVTQELSASAGGVGSVRYRGNPKNVTKTSSGFLGSIKSDE